MFIARRILPALLACACLAPSLPALAQDLANRQELRRVDLSGAPNMEIVTSVTDLKPGDQIPLHLHHGVETAYILEGGMIEMPGKPAVPLPTGASVVNLRDVNHGGFKVVGDKTIRMLTVHVVDKGKPLYDAPAP